MVFKENMLIKIDNDIYRLIDTDINRRNIFIININKKYEWNKVIEEGNLEKLFEIGEAKEVEDKTLIISDNELTEEMIKKRNFYYEVVSFLMKSSPDYEIYYRGLREPIIQETMVKYNLSYSTIKRVFCEYVRNGKVANSLVPKLFNCGGKGKERVIKNRDGVIIDLKIKELFKTGINKYYNNTKKNSLKTCYELIIRDYLKENPKSEIPTINQFYYWYKKISKDNKQKEITKRFGSRIYQQTSRAIVGNSLDDALSPAELYQIDSTILDVYIVSKLNRNLIIGRPVLYLVIDVYSRLITGINVTIEPFNSYEGVKGALINTMSDKVKYCEKFGIKINNEWNVKCIPSRILADRGELLSKNIENAISNLGIMIQNTPPYRGDMKGIVEKAFERIHSYIKPFCEGVVENKFNKVERGEEDYRLKANLTLEEITKIIIKCVLFHNNHHVLNSYEGDGLNINNDIPKIPSKIWEYGVKEKKGLLKELSEDVIRINLLNNKEASVTAKGVRVNGLYYVSSWTLEEGWFQKARINGVFKVKISYDPNDLSSIYYIKENGTNFDELKLVSYQEQYKNLGEEELKQIIEYEKKLNKEAEEMEIREKISLYDEIEKVTSKAKEESERSKDKSISKSKKLRGIRENLDKERKRVKKEENKNLNSSEETEDDELDVFEMSDKEWGDYYE